MFALRDILRQIRAITRGEEIPDSTLVTTERPAAPTLRATLRRIHSIIHSTDSRSQDRK